MGEHRTVRFLGIELAAIEIQGAVRCAFGGGFFLAPSGPGLCGLEWDREYRDALLAADVNLADSGLAIVFYAGGFAWFDPRRGAGRSALAFVAAVSTSVVALTLETMQTQLPGRFFDPDDIAWSMAGALTGALLAWLAGLLLPKHS